MLKSPTMQSDKSPAETMDSTTLYNDEELVDDGAWTQISGPSDDEMSDSDPVVEIGFSNDPRKRLRQHRHHESSNHLINLAEAIFDVE